jgi:hypothetical protein
MIHIGSAEIIRKKIRLQDVKQIHASYCANLVLLRHLLPKAVNVGY